MIPRKYRASRNDIEKTIKTGFTENLDCLYAKVSRGDTEKVSFSIIVPKKCFSSSVDRHLIKRRISDVIEKNLGVIPENFGKTVVFFAKKTEKSPSYAEIKRGVEGILKKVL